MRPNLTEFSRLSKATPPRREASAFKILYKIIQNSINPSNSSPTEKVITMKASVRIIAAAGFVAALGVAPLISIAQETPAADASATTATTTTSTSVSADASTTASASESTSTSVAADGTVTDTSSSSESSSTSSAGQ